MSIISQIRFKVYRFLLLIYLSLLLPTIAYAICPAYVRFVGATEYDNDFFSIHDEEQTYFVRAEDIGQYLNIKPGYIDIRLHNAKGILESRQQFIAYSGVGYTVTREPNKIGLKIMEDVPRVFTKTKFRGSYYNLSEKTVSIKISQPDVEPAIYKIPPFTFSEYQALPLQTYKVISGEKQAVLYGSNDRNSYDIFIMDKEEKIYISVINFIKTKDSCTVPINVQYSGY